jgi:Protein of unknown function (DUF3574)
MVLRRAALLILAAVWPSFALADPCPIAGQTPMLIVQMFFGQNIAGKKNITPAAWHGFLRMQVTPRFPDGFTVFDAYGQWRDTATSRIDRERSKVVEIATPETPDVVTKIQELAATYRKQFRQQSVGIVTTPGCAAF